MSDVQRPIRKAARFDPSRRNFVMAAASTAAVPVVARTLITDAAAARQQATDRQDPGQHHAQGQWARASAPARHPHQLA